MIKQIAKVILVVSAMLAPALLHAQDVVMPAEFDSNPGAPDKARQRFVYSVDPDGNSVPLKTIRITNNFPITIYPILRAGNETVQGSGGKTPGIGLYDPYDPVLTEYRAYIGYKGTDGKYYFGLKPGTSILVRIPLVFWDSCRMVSLTDSRYLLPAPGAPNPLTYDSNSTRFIAAAENDVDDRSLIRNGVVMWYRNSPVIDPAADAPAQLMEWTIRDVYLANPQFMNRSLIPENQRLTLINYDVSYVDNLFSSMALAAREVPLNIQPYPSGLALEDYGWVGAVSSVDEFQNALADFTENTGIAKLGDYFGGKGWPTYYIPNPDPLDEIKIPSGANIILQSPYNNAFSSYVPANGAYLLSSGGIGQIRAGIGAAADTPGSGNTIYLAPGTPASDISFIQVGYRVTFNPADGNPNVLPKGARVVKVTPGAEANDPAQVVLDTSFNQSAAGGAFMFTRPVTDYASDALVKLWYSWALYYGKQTRNTPTVSAVGSVAKNNAQLTFREPRSGLIKGMLVTGPGLDNPDPAQKKGGVVVLDVSPDNSAVYLSQLSREDHPLAEGQNYTFKAPQPLPSAPGDLYQFDFSGETPDPSRVPLEFAANVYVAIASLSQVPVDTTKLLDNRFQVLSNIIGANVGFILLRNGFTSQDIGGSTVDYGNGNDLQAKVRDIIKSLLRGVTDFREFPDDSDWYPAPDTSLGGVGFNPFNLDPYVWFVHRVLGLSGYGFSVDDDKANVGAPNTSKLTVSLGGTTNGLKEKAEWFPNCPYGPFVTTGVWKASNSRPYDVGITGATNTSPITISAGNHGLSEGDTVNVSEVLGNTAANGTFTVARITLNTFQLVGSHGNGAYTSGGKFNTGKLPVITFSDPSTSAYFKVLGIDPTAGLQGARVNGGAGVPLRNSVRVLRLGDAKEMVLFLTKGLQNADGTPLADGSYQWQFSGD